MIYSCKCSVQFSSVQSISHVRLFATTWTAACQASLSITNSQSLPRFVSIQSVMPSNHLILINPFPSHLPSFPTSGSFLMSQFFTSGSQSIGASASASVQWIFRTDFLYDWLIGSPWNPRDSQESSPIPQFKSISVLLTYVNETVFAWKPAFLQDSC